jgi:hypothetical protein
MKKVVELHPAQSVYGAGGNENMTTGLDDYWNKEEFVGRLLLPPRDDERDVFFLWHQSRERYGKNHKDLGLTLAEPGERDYIHVRACFYSPRIILTIPLEPPIPSAIGDEIGEVVGSRQEGQNRHDVANLQAWYYQAEKTLMLWEVDLFRAYGEEQDPGQDFLLSSLWTLFERELIRQFPECQRIITPHSEPDYKTELFQAFLQERGFSPGCAGSGIFEKILAGLTF